MRPRIAVALLPVSKLSLLLSFMTGNVGLILRQKTVEVE